MNKGRYFSSASKIFLTIVNLCIVGIACVIVCPAGHSPIHSADRPFSVARGSMFRVNRFIITRRVRAGPARVTEIRLAGVVSTDQQEIAPRRCRLCRGLQVHTTLRIRERWKTNKSLIYER
jgi:ferredoxin